MKKRFLALFLALLLAPMWALGEDLLYEVDPETGEVLFLVDPEEEIELESVAQDALDLVDGQMNILLLGIDARPGQESGRSDTMILLTVDANQKTVKLTSFMRDLYVEIPGYKNNRLNAAYRFGGPELLFETLKENFGIEVDQYVTVNFTMMADLVNQIGGLELDVESEYIRDRINAVIKMDNKAHGFQRFRAHAAPARSDRGDSRKAQKRVFPDAAHAARGDQFRQRIHQYVPGDDHAVGARAV